jgi:predicted permease
MQSLLEDIRLGLRMLARNPGSTLLIVGLLSLGLGTTTALFSLYDVAFLRRLPVRHPEELVRMVQHIPKIGTYSDFPYPYYEALHDHAATLATTFGEAWKYMHFALTDPEPPEEITVRAVTPEFFEALGVRALYGRVLLPGDANEIAGTPPAVMSYGFWRQRFGGDAGVVNGRTVLVNGHRFVIVGVLARDFNGFTLDTAPDLRVPLSAFPLLVDFTRDQTRFELAGRLKPGFTRLQAEAECRVIWQATMKDYYQNVEKRPSQVASEMISRGMGLEPLERGVSLLRDRYGNVLKMMMASAGLLVLIICINVGGLLLARAAAREHEIAVRLAVGATRFRLVRQVLAESFLLAALGATGALLIALAAMPLAVRSLPPIRDLASSLVPLSVDVGINWRVFLFLLALSLVTMLLFSLSPAIAVFRSNLDNLLRAVRSSHGWRGRQALITFQIALCTFLLAIASLFVRTFQRLQQTDPGFDRDHIATFTLDLAAQTGTTAGFLRTLTERVREMPGVVSVAAASRGVMRDRGLGATIAPAGRKITRADFLNTSFNYVSPEYFDTMGMHILAGRDFIPDDAPGPKQADPLMAVVNQAFAEQFFPDTSPVGKQFGPGGLEGVAQGKYQIIGVVSDAKYRSLREPIIPTFYTLDTNFSQLVLNVRTGMRPDAIIEPVRKALASVSPTLPFLEVHTLAQEVDDSIASERLTAALASLFGAIAALLVGAGIFGLLAYVVTERRREIGIRMALGAQPLHIGKLIAGQTLAMTAVGVAMGLTGALIAGPGIRSLLYGISPQDPKSLVAAMIFMALTAAVATILPAVRATAVDPMVALRYE